MAEQGCRGIRIFNGLLGSWEESGAGRMGMTDAGAAGISACMAASIFRWERFSKAIGVPGGYVCGAKDLIEFLYHRARPFLFPTSHPPAVAASSIAAFEILEGEPERIERLGSNSRYFKKGLGDAGFNTGIGETPITPAIVGDAARAHQFSSELFREGMLVTGIGFPTVAKDKARVRTIVTATHTREVLDRRSTSSGGILLHRKRSAEPGKYVQRLYSCSEAAPASRFVE